MLAFYIGGMGAKGQNYHTKLAARMGLGEQAERIQDLFFEGKGDQAVGEVPVEFADEISLVGTPARIADRVAAWKESAVTEILIHAGDLATVRRAAEIILPV
jgi:alkanesulfonate monooxygenase SsuD/methylene tetrahydromethanopterin reductase-like flavin-dependent oxidoreductase (luciferase family)